MRCPGLTAVMLATALVATSSVGQEMPAPAQGYLFGQPRLLTQQLIWGLAHGVKLLATTCADSANGPVATAYAEWFGRHGARIAAAERDLAQHYFGRDTASEEDLAGAMHLAGMLHQRPDEMDMACASFARAIAGERYDLELFYRLHRDAARIERARAVHSRVGACLKQLPAESAAALAAKFATWTEANGTLENVSRSRLFDHDRDPSWQRDAGSGAEPPTVTCPQLAAALDRSDYALSDVFGDADQ